MFGMNWVSSFDYSLTVPVAESDAWLQRPDGRRIRFILDKAAGFWKEDEAGAIASLLLNEDGTYTHRGEQGWTEKYLANGYPLEIRNRQGIGWTLVLSAAIVSQALIITIQHSSGSHIRANFGFQGEISSAEDPAGIVYAYTHDLEAHDPVATACAPPLALRPIQPSPPTTVNGPRSPMHSPACPTHWENPQFELLTYAPTGMPGITDRHGVEYALIIHGWISPSF